MTLLCHEFPFWPLLLIPYALGLILPSILRRNSTYRRLAMLSAAVAILGYGALIWLRIFDVQAGQNLSLLNVGSLISLIIYVVMTMAMSRNRSWFLLPIVYIFAMIHVAFIALIPGGIHYPSGSNSRSDGPYRPDDIFLCGADL